MVCGSWEEVYTSDMGQSRSDFSGGLLSCFFFHVTDVYFSVKFGVLLCSYQMSKVI
jgi:hypothetical protein